MFWKKKVESEKQTWICGYSSTPDPATQYGKWNHVFDTKEEVEHFIRKGWTVYKQSENTFFCPTTGEYFIIVPNDEKQNNMTTGSIFRVLESFIRH